MAKPVKTTPRFTLPARIRNKHRTAADFPARMALIDRIADLPGIETVECSDEIVPRRVDIFLRREAADRVLKRQPQRLLCSIDCEGLTLNGLDRWERHQVLATGWGRLVDKHVCVFLPRDKAELKVVWSVVERAHKRLSGPVAPEAGTLVISTWDWPRYSRTSLQ